MHMKFLQPIINFGKKLLGYWKRFSYAWGWINTRIIFTIIYIVFFGIYFLVTRLISFFTSRKVGLPSTFWKDKKYTPPTLETLERQF
jgi:hypothetical protein